MKRHNACTFYTEDNRWDSVQISANGFLIPKTVPETDVTMLRKMGNIIIPQRFQEWYTKAVLRIAFGVDKRLLEKSKQEGLDGYGATWGMCCSSLIYGIWIIMLTVFLDILRADS